MLSRKELSFSYLKSLRKNSVAWSFLRAHEFAISFLHSAFIVKNRRSILYKDLKSELSDYLYFLQQKYGDDEKTPKDDAEYHLKRWTNPENPFLSVRYDKKDNEVVDLMPGTEKALRWLESLEERTFVGTESRLKNIFNQLEELIEGTETDDGKAIKKLEQKKKEIEKQIEEAKAGKREKLTAREIKESFIQIEDEARNLLSDFRQIEDNFRKLDRGFREKITTSDGSKGKVLDNLFGKHDAIYSSDQGKSFRAFWEFLMQEDRADEIRENLKAILNLEETVSEKENSVLANFVRHLIESAEKVNSVNNQLTSQLKRFLNDKTILENKRMMAIISSLEESLLMASAMVDPKINISETNTLSPSINIEFSRGIYLPSEDVTIEFKEEDKIDSEEGYENLFNVHYVDEGELLARIDFLLSKKGNDVGILDIVEAFPIEKGLNEIACYYNIVEKRRPAKINSEEPVLINISSNDNFQKKLECPNIIFERRQ